MELTPEQRDNLRRWGIDPNHDEAEIVRLLNERYVELRKARRDAEKPHIVDMSSERR